MKKWQLTVFSLTPPLFVGAIAGIVTARNVRDWYPGLHKPGFTPPNELFGPVWALLYIAMGISLYLVLREPRSRDRTNAIICFGVQLFINFWWSFVFFQFHLIAFAVVVIVALWGCIIVMIRLFYKVSEKAAILQFPYLAWVSFAAALNIAIWYLN